jgi:hypothetical protein
MWKVIAERFVDKLRLFLFIVQRVSLRISCVTCACIFLVGLLHLFFLGNKY